MKKIIIFAVAGVVLVGAGIGGAMFFLKSPEEPMEEEMVEEEMMPEEKDAIYEDMHPAFTVNFNDDSTKKFMQVYMVAKFYDMESRDQFKMHMPVVRNNLLMLMSGKNSDELASKEAKEMLGKEALSTAQSVMQDIYGDNLVADIYFTKLVMQ